MLLHFKIFTIFFFVMIRIKKTLKVCNNLRKIGSSHVMGHFFFTLSLNLQLLTVHRIQYYAVCTGRLDRLHVTLVQQREA